ncbi:MAG: phage tail tape measure protein [Clostridia bacterium]
MATEIVSEIAVRLGLEADGLAKDAQSANKVIKELNKEFKYLDKASKGSQNELERLSDISKILSSKLEVVEQALKETKNTMESTKSEIRRLTEEKKRLTEIGEQESQQYKEIERQLKEYYNSLEESRKEATQLGTTLQSTQKQIQKYADEFKRTEQALDVFGKVAEETGTDVKELARQLNIDIDVSDYRQLENALKEIKSSANNLTNETRQLIDNITNVGNRARNSSQDLGRMADSLDEVSRNTRLDVISDGVDALADTFGDAGRAIVDFGKDSVMSFAEFEQTVVGAVMKTDNGIKDLDKSMEGLQELGAKFPITNQELATSFDDLSASGFSASESLEILEGSLNASKAVGEDLEAVVGATSSSYAIFGDQVESVADLQDIMANAANLGKISVEELGKQLVKTGGNANNLGMDVEEVSAVLAELTNEGLSAEASGEKLNSMLRQLANPSKDAKALLSDLNVEIFDSQGNFRGFTTVMDELGKATSDMSQEQKNLAMNTLFGADASSTASTYMEKGIENTDKYSETLKNTTGYVDELTGAIKENAETANSIEQLGATFDSLKATIGEALAPVLNTVLPMVTNLVQAFIDADPWLQNIIITIGMIVGVFGVLMGALAPVIMAITSLITVFGGASAVAGALAGAFAFLTGPIGLAIGAITAVIAIGVALVKNWDTISSSCSKVWGQITSYIKNKTDEIKNNVTNWINKVKSDIERGFKKVEDNITKVWNTIKQNIDKAWTNIKTGVDTGVKNVKTAISTVFDTLETIMTAPFKAAQKVIDGILGGIGKGISAVTNGISKVTGGKKGKSIDMPMPTNDDPTSLDIPTFYDNLDDVKMYQRDMKDRSIANNSSEIASKMAVATSNLAIIDALKQQNQLLMDIITNTDSIGDLGNTQQDINLNIDGRQIAKATARYIQPELKSLDSRANRLGTIL